MEEERPWLHCCRWCADSVDSAMIRRLRTASIIEATTYLFLVAATVMKYAGGDDRGVSLLGPIHGVLFLVFAALVMTNYERLGWPLWRAVTALFIGSLPFGGFWVERKWLAPLDVSPR